MAELTWRTSSYSGGNGSCVEVASRAAEVLVRDTKDRPGGMLSFTHDQWRALGRKLA
jgi:hypothetical protein